MNYLSDFFMRTQPLADFTIVEKQIYDDFNYKWNEGTIRGWEKEPDLKSDGANFFCEACDKSFSNDNTFIVASPHAGPLQRQEAQKEPGALRADQNHHQTPRCACRRD